MELTENELKSLLADAAAEGIREYEKHKETERKNTRYKTTFNLLKSYRDAVIHTAAGQKPELENLDAEQQGLYIRSIRRSKFKTLLILEHIDVAVEELKKRRAEKGREIEYKAFDMYFMQGCGYEDIAAELNTSKNTPRNWVTAAVSELSVMLWGLDEDALI